MKEKASYIKKYYTPYNFPWSIYDWSKSLRKIGAYVKCRLLLYSHFSPLYMVDVSINGRLLLYSHFSTLYMVDVSIKIAVKWWLYYEHHVCIYSPSSEYLIRDEFLPFSINSILKCTLCIKLYWEGRKSNVSNQSQLYFLPIQLFFPSKHY